MRSTILFAILLILTTSSGCSLFGAFTPEEIVKHPDSPMQILEVDGHYARVAIYDARKNRMIEYGWVDLEDSKAWTIHKFDWEKHIKSREREKDRRW